MNKVLNINLGGYPITIDSDAYEMLENYLDTIENHFSNSEGCDEIISDIESRLAEIFTEELGKRSIVGIVDIEKAIAIMGTPADFGAEPIENGNRKSSHNSKTSEDGFKFGKRLYRDPEDLHIAGVCSGLAAYFGIEDPLWVRLAFVFFTISGGVGVMTYIVIWAITKEAKTASDRLAMRGEPINVSNIGKKVEESANRFSEKVSEWGEDEKWEEWTNIDKWKKKGKKMKDDLKKKARKQKIVDNDVLPKGFLW